MKRRSRETQENFQEPAPISEERFFILFREPEIADRIPVTHYGQIRLANTDNCIQAQFSTMKMEKCLQTPSTTDPETQNFALLTNGMLRTIPFQNCLSGRILILCFQPDEEWNEIEPEIPDYKKWQYVKNQFKIQSSQQCRIAENDLVTMKTCNLNSPDQL